MAPQKAFNKGKKALQGIHPNNLLLFGAICTTLLAAELPFIIGTLTSSPDHFFIGVSPQAPGDYMIYYNLIDQSRNGAWFFENFFTGEQHIGKYLSPFWLFVGKYANLFNLPTRYAYEIIKLFFGGLLIFTLYKGTQSIFGKKNYTHTALALAISIFGGGLSLFAAPYIEWILNTVTENQGLFYPIDTFVSEAFVLTAISHSGLFSFSITLFVLILHFFFKRNIGNAQMFLMLLSGFFLALIHTYDIITLFITLGLYTAYIFTQKENVEEYIKKIALLIIATGSALIYLLSTFLHDPIIGGWIKQNEVQTPHLFPTLVGFGLLLPLFLFGAYKSFKEKNKKLILLSIWGIVAFALAFSPFSFQRKLLQGISIPFGILSAASLIYFNASLERIKKNTLRHSAKAALITIACIGIFLSSAYSIVYKAYEYTLAEPPYYLSASTKEALTFLENNTTTSDRILASYLHAQYIGGLINRRSIFSDRHQTINYEKKEKEFLQFMQFKNNIAWKEEYLKANNIDFLYYDKAQKREYDFDIKTLESLKIVFENDEIVIFKVSNLP